MCFKQYAARTNKARVRRSLLNLLRGEYFAQHSETLVQEIMRWDMTMLRESIWYQVEQLK